MAQKKAPPPLTEQLRRVIRDSGQSQYAICKALGIQFATLSRFLSGERGLSMEALDKLGQHLDLELKQRPTKGR